MEQKKHRIITFLFFLTLPLLGLGLPIREAKAKSFRGTTRKLSWRFHSQMIAFQGITGLKNHKLRRVEYQILLKAMRKGVELPRFVPINVRKTTDSSGGFVRRMVSVVVKKARILAEKRAEWSGEIQGYRVTSKLLRSVQNQSFFYSIHWSKSRVNGRLGYKIPIHQVLIFDCSLSNRGRSSKHKEACIGKKEQDFVGISSLIYTIEPNLDRQTSNVRNEQERERWKSYCESVTSVIRKKMEELFPLYAPIAYSKMESVFLSLGKYDGLRLNSFMKIYVLHTSGLLMYRGLVKVRHLGDNRLKKEGRYWVRVDPKGSYFSRARTIYGRGIYRPRKGMLLKEYPMWGYSIGMQFGFMPVHSSLFIDSPPTQGFQFLSSNTNVPSIGFTVDVDASHRSGISEFFYEGQFELVLFSHHSEKSGKKANISVLGSLGVIKKYSWRRLFFLFGARFGGGVMLDQGLLLGGDAFSGLELFLSPHIQLALRFGLRCYVPIVSSAPFIGDYWLAGLWTRAGFFFSF